MEFHDRAVVDGLSAEVETLRAENARLRKALEELAEQTLTVEMTPGHRTIADYEGAYNSMVGVARAALAPQEPDHG